MATKKKDLYDDLAKVVHLKTVKWAKEQGVMAERKPKPLSLKGRAALAAINGGDFGCQEESVIKLVSVLIGEELPVLSDGSENRADWNGAEGIVIFMTGNADSHDYGSDLFEVVNARSASSCRGVKVNGQFENNPSNIRSIIGIPTVTQIAAYYRARYGS